MYRCIGTTTPVTHPLTNLIEARLDKMHSCFTNAPSTVVFEFVDGTAMCIVPNKQLGYINDALCLCHSQETFVESINEHVNSIRAVPVKAETHGATTKATV